MNATELKYELIRRGVNPDAYRICNEMLFAEEQYCLDNTNGKWQVYYAQRGARASLEEFERESDACERLLELLMKDSSVYKNG